MRELQRKPGPWIGRILDALLEAVTNDPAVNEPQALLARARELAADPEGRGGAS